MSDSASVVGTAKDWSSRTKRWLQPFPVLMIIYFGYFLIVYSGFWRYAYWELMSLNTNIMGFHPAPDTVARRWWAIPTSKAPTVRFIRTSARTKPG